jgi:hypothetical protein
MMIGIGGPEPAGLAARLKSRGHTVLILPRELGRLPEVDVVLLFGSDADYADLVCRRRADCARPPRLLNGSRAPAAGPSAAVPAG